jgi:hypothetical protein
MLRNMRKALAAMVGICKFHVIFCQKLHQDISRSLRREFAFL